MSQQEQGEGFPRSGSRCPGRLGAAGLREVHRRFVRMKDDGWFDGGAGEKGKDELPGDWTWERSPAAARGLLVVERHAVSLRGSISGRTQCCPKSPRSFAKRLRNGYRKRKGLRGEATA